MYIQDELYIPIVGEDSIICKELGSEFIELALVQQALEAGIVEAAWDTSLHSTDLLNKVIIDNISNPYREMIKR